MNRLLNRQEAMFHPLYTHLSIVSFTPSRPFNHLILNKIL